MPVTMLPLFAKNQDLSADYKTLMRVISAENAAYPVSLEFHHFGTPAFCDGIRIATGISFPRRVLNNLTMQHASMAETTFHVPMISMMHNWYVTKNANDNVPMELYAKTQFLLAKEYHKTTADKTFLGWNAAAIYGIGIASGTRRFNGIGGLHMLPFISVFLAQELIQDMYRAKVIAQSLAKSCSKDEIRVLREFDVRIGILSPWIDYTSWIWRKYLGQANQTV